MKIALFGATGMLGRKIVASALEQKIEVRALVRSPDKLGELSDKLEIVAGDYFSPQDQAKTLEGVDLVISTIGPPSVRKGGPKAEQFGEAMTSLINEMNAKGITRIVNVAGASASYTGEKITISRHIMRWLMKLTVPEITPAKELEITLLRSSGLAYTTFRPPMIANNLAGSIQFSNTKTMGMKVDAAQLADLMLDVLDKPDWHNKLPFVATSS